MISKSNLISWSFVVSLSLFLPACSVLPKPKPASTIYRLTVSEGNTAVAVTQTKVVNIEYPTASKALSGLDIILSPDGRRLSAASQAQWAEPVPSLLRNVLIDTLASNPDVTGIIPKGSTRVPYRLNVDIRRFEAVFDNGQDAPPDAVIQMSLSLTETKARQLIGSYSVKANARARSVSVSAIVDAQDNAAREAMHNISDWLSAQLDGKTHTH